MDIATVEAVVDMDTHMEVDHLDTDIRTVEERTITNIYHQKVYRYQVLPMPQLRHPNLDITIIMAMKERRSNQHLLPRWTWEEYSFMSLPMPWDPWLSVHQPVSSSLRISVTRIMLIQPFPSSWFAWSSIQLGDYSLNLPWSYFKLFQHTFKLILYNESCFKRLVKYNIILVSCNCIIIITNQYPDSCGGTPDSLFCIIYRLMAFWPSTSFMFGNWPATELLHRHTFDVTTSRNIWPLLKRSKNFSTMREFIQQPFNLNSLISR